MVYQTLDESWMDLPTYRAAEIWATQALGLGQQRRCLIIGSPMKEVRSLVKQEWQVTYLDIRTPPSLIGPEVDVKLGDACQQPFDDETFDAISSTCVICHVGTGRYGDDLRPDGPITMLRECARVLKPGGLLVMMAGPVATQSSIAEKHRVVTIKEVQDWCQETGFLWRGHAHTRQDTNIWAKKDDDPDGYLCVTWVRQ